MSALIGALRVSLSAETAQFEAGMKRAQKTTASTSSAITKSLGTMKAGLAGLAAGLSVGLLARGFLAAADASKQMNAQLKLATAASGNFATAQKDVARIAQVTRTGLVETASLYATFQRNALELGISQEQAARATESVSKAFQISGASAAEAAGGLRQFLQGVQSGTLRGEELNSVLENAPRLARLLADSLGVTIGELRALGKEGELTGDKLIKALTDKKFTDALDSEFRELPVTFDQAMTLVQNAAITTFGAFDRGGEFSTALANFIGDGADGFVDLGKSAEDLGIEIRAIMDGLGDVFQPMLAGALSVFGEIGGAANALRNTIAEVLGGYDIVRNLAPRAGNWINEKTNNADRYKLSDTSGTFLRGARKSEVDRKLKMMFSPESLLQFGNKSPTPKGRMGGSSGKAKKAKKGRTPRAPRDRSDDVAFQFSQELLSAEADVLRAQRDLAKSSDERAALSVALLNIQQQQQQAELNNRVRRAERDFAEGKIDAATLEQAKTQAGILSAQYAKKNALERQALDEENAAQKSRDALELSQSATDIEIELLQNQSALVRTAAEKREVELRILAVMKEQERARLDALYHDQTASDLARAEAKQRLDNLDAIYAGREAQVMDGTKGPLASYFSELPKDAAALTEALEEVQVRGLQGIEQGLMGVITGAKSMKEVFHSVINSIVQDLLRLAIQKFVMGALGKAIGGIGGISGGGMSAQQGALAIGNFGLAPTAGTGGWAKGGSAILGGRGGTDRNLLSLNGLPISRVSKGERVSVSNDNGGAVGLIQIVPSPYFDVVVDGRVQQGAAPMAARAAMVGAAGGAASIHRRASRQLP